MDTRSLSIASIGTEPSGTNTSIETGPPRTNSTSIGNALSHADSYTNLALLYYETSTGNVSALLQRTTSTVQEAEWVDITSQKSQSLPDEFRYGNDSFMSHTLYESIGAYATLSTPFTSGAIPSESIVGSESIFGSPPNIWAVFYSPPNASLLPLYYSVGPSGSGNFSSGMHCLSFHSE